ncbi:hypothetical protein BJ138DRAFT_1111701 [Hygrophoropsis aurantiaca]|uniref:Uncharacterized protein n=1 Tax=Hygrophoropsis aurantiaca TaxID=72124 RepID=A0ACB8AHZ6_9AGAM|nr:hypothetical protein BJ138DRAFT_1111701 [Hygrophoropsis aurantiaca]
MVSSFYSWERQWAQKLQADENELVNFIPAATGTNITMQELAYITESQANIRMVDSLGKGIVFIIAVVEYLDLSRVAPFPAECLTFYVPQGLNSSVQDSFNLSWKLAIVAKALAATALLDTYTAERISVIAEILEITTELLNQATQKKRNDANSRLKLFMLGVNYRFSSIVVDEFVTEKATCQCV